VADVIGLFVAGTGGVQDGLVMFDVPTDGDLIGIDWDFHATLNASEFYEVELSFIATNLLGTSDVRGRISSISQSVEVITAVGVAQTNVQKWISGMNISMAGGERLFVHVNATAGVVTRGRINLFFDFAVSPVRRSARRR